MTEALTAASKERPSRMRCTRCRRPPGLPSRDHQVERLWRSTWEPLVQSYIRECEPLRAMLYAHDIRWKVSPEVRSFLSEVQLAGLPVVLVLTKDDKRAAGWGRERKSGLQCTCSGNWAVPPVACVHVEV